MGRDSNGPTDALLGDYRKHLGKNYMGRWDLANPDGTYRPALVTIEGVFKYQPPPFVLKKQLARAQKEGKNPPREFLVRFVGHRKGWICRSEAMSSICAATGGETKVEAWIGKEIVIFLDTKVRNPSGGPPGGIRARAKRGSEVQQPPPPPADNAPDEAIMQQLAEAYGDDVDFDGADESSGEPL